MLVSAATLRLVRDAVRGRTAKRRRSDGVPRSTELIEGAPGTRAQIRHAARRTATTSWPRCARAFEAAARDERRCVVFTGRSARRGSARRGSRGSSLLELRGEATVLVGRCVSYGEGATFLPLARDDRGFGELLDDAGSTGEIFLAARRRFEELAAERPLLLVFEDVHWAEPTLLDLVEYLAAQATGAPILALCLARPDLLAERAGWGDRASLALEPLDGRRRPASWPATSRTPTASSRSPRATRSTSSSSRPTSARRAQAALDTVPGSIEALLASRLDRLGAGGARRGAARGGRRPAVLARRRSRRSGRSTRSRRSSRRASSAARGTVYRFHHVLVRDVVYAGTPKAERAELHRQHADWLDGAAGRLGRARRLPPRAGGGYLRRAGRARAAGDAASRRTRAAVSAPPGSAAWKRGDARATVEPARPGDGTAAGAATRSGSSSCASSGKRCERRGD